MKKRMAGTTQIFLQAGSSRKAGTILRKYMEPQPVFLVHSSGRWLQPLLEEVEENLNENGYDKIIRYDGISSNPHFSECDEGIKLARENGARIVVALGAGSYIDAPKYIASKVKADFNLSIPTTAGTASYFNEWSVMTDDDKAKKSTIARAPEIAILDPEALTSLPPHLSFYNGMDCFSHGLEAYFTESCPPDAAREALQGCRIVVNNLEKVLENGDDVALRGKMFEADLLTGRAMMKAGLGILHCIANVISGFYPHYQHGFLCGVLLWETVEYNKIALPPKRLNKILPLHEKMTDIFYSHFTDQPPVIIEKKDLMIKKEDLPGIIHHAVNNVNAATNPRPVTPEIVEQIIRNTFYVG